MTMSKTAALKRARRLVQIDGRGNSWTIYGPYYMTPDRLDGPTTTRSADSYWSARAKRAVWVAEIAAELMGIDPYEVGAYKSLHTGFENAQMLLEGAITASKKRASR
jgi:hypothetical protein